MAIGHLSQLWGHFQNLFSQFCIHSRSSHTHFNTSKRFTQQSPDHYKHTRQVCVLYSGLFCNVSFSSFFKSAFCHDSFYLWKTEPVHEHTLQMKYGSPLLTHTGQNMLLKIIIMTQPVNIFIFMRWKAKIMTLRSLNDSVMERFHLFNSFRLIISSWHKKSKFWHYYINQNYINSKLWLKKLKLRLINSWHNFTFSIHDFYLDMSKCLIIVLQKSKLRHTNSYL